MTGMVPALQCQAVEQAPPEPTVAAAQLLADLTSVNNANSGNSGSSGGKGALPDRLHAGLALVAALAADSAQLHPDLAEAIAAAELPAAAVDDVLQLLTDPAAVSACVQVITAESSTPAAGPAAAARHSVLLRQSAACVLQLAVMAEPEVATALSAGSCLASLVRLVASGSTADRTPQALKASVLQLLHSLCSAAATAASPPAADTLSAASAADGTSVPSQQHPAAAAVDQLVKQHKVVPCLVQLLGEVRVSRGKAVLSTVGVAPQSENSAATAKAVAPQLKGGRPAYSAAATASKGNKMTTAAGSDVARRQAGRPAVEAGAAAAAVSGAAAASTPGIRSPGHTDTMLEALKLLATLSSAYVVSWLVSIA